MIRSLLLGLFAALVVAESPILRAQEEPVADLESAGEVSFLQDVAPILVENCVGCHNPKKSESRYDLTTFDALAKGGAMGEGIMLEPGDPDLSYFVELIRPEGVPRMPHKTDPLPDEERMTIERWVSEGAHYDGEDPEADWVALVHRALPVVIPESYPYPLPITALAFSPSGEQIVASGYHELNRYAAADGSLGTRTPGLGERVYDLAFSPDGGHLATASGDPGQAGYGRLWTVAEDGSLADPQLLVESVDAVFAVAFSPDGSRLAFVGADRALRVFDVASGERLAEVEDHADWVLDVAYSPDGTRLATASRDKTSKLFDANTFESLVTFPGHGDAVHCVGFTEDGKLVASGGADARVRIWNPEDDAKQVRELGGFDGPVFDLVLSNNGSVLAASGADPTIRLFKTADGASLRNLEGHGDWVYRLALTRDGATLASGAWDGEVRLWNLADGAPLQTFIAAPGHAPEQDDPPAGAGAD